MKLKNVHYEYRGNDIWRIYFKDALEADDFRNITIEDKPQIAMLLPIFTNGKGVRYCVEAKLTGQFSILRRYVKDSTNNYFSNDVWTNLVKKIEGADSDYLFDDIDLWYDATFDKCYFRICCMNGTWTEFFVKNMLNSQFGMVAQANGYYGTDNAYQGGLCTRRSCCGIGFGTSMNKYDNVEERIIFTVKNFCNGETVIVKVSPWTNTFIGINEEKEEEYSWNDFKQYMQKLSSTGEDIWDIEWEYDETCPMTGTEVADKLHLYLKPLAYKRLFEEKEEKQLLKNITDVSSCMTKVLGCGTLYYYNLYFDDKSDLKNVDVKHINRSMLTSVKGTYYIRVVSYNKELPKNISSATLVWDQEENRYSVEDFTIKGYRKDDKKVWISTASLWSNDDYLARVKALTPPPVPYWMKQDEDSKIGFRQKDADEVQKEIDEMTKKIYEKLDIKQVKDFDVDTAWHEYLTATEMAKLGADFDGDTVCEYCKRDVGIVEEMADVEPLVYSNHKIMTLTEFNASIKDTNNKEEKNMGPKDTTFAEFCRRIYWGTITPVKPERVLIQGTATIIWWSDGTKTVVKCQKGDKMDPEKGIAMCVMKKFMGTNETHSNYLDFAKPAIKDYEAKQKAMAAARKKAADKKRRAAKKEEKGNGEA